MEVSDAKAELGGRAHEAGLITTGASVFPPLKINVPPKFCGELFVTRSSRRRTPNLQKCLPCAIEVLFCNSNLFCLLTTWPVCAPPPLNDPRTSNAGSELLG